MTNKPTKLKSFGGIPTTQAWLLAMPYTVKKVSSQWSPPKHFKKLPNSPCARCEPDSPALICTYFQVQTPTQIIDLRHLFYFSD